MGAQKNTALPQNLPALPPPIVNDRSLTVITNYFHQGTWKEKIDQEMWEQKENCTYKGSLLPHCIGWNLGNLIDI